MLRMTDQCKQLLSSLINRFLIFFCFLQIGSLPLQGSETQNPTTSKYTIVFVHIGESLPSYIDLALKQARLFNPDCPIFLVANQRALDGISTELLNEKLEIVSCESLNKTLEHEEFCNKFPGHSGFWFWAVERFFYIYDLMEQYELHDVFHLENDNMLYADLETILPVFQENYPGIAAPFDYEHRCIPSFVYIHTKESMQRLAEFIAVRGGGTDMELIAQYRNISNPSDIDNLPLIHKEYSYEYPLKNRSGFTTPNPHRYWNHIEDFESLFDAAALGQYIGGVHVNPTPGFINECSLFDPSILKYVWEEDFKGRRVPYAVFQEIKYPIVNLHIHSKQLWKFSSQSL